MATKKATTEEQAQEEAAQAQAVTETAEAQTKAVSAPAAMPGKNQDQIVAKVPALESLSILADRHRVPAWMQQALLRFMGWLDDKRVSDEEYTAALEQLKTRRIGGGRR